MVQEMVLLVQLVLLQLVVLMDEVLAAVVPLTALVVLLPVAKVDTEQLLLDI
jgi:hypothetical protein